MSLPQKEKSCWGKWGNLSTRDLLCYTRAYFDVGCCNIFVAVESNERFLHPTNGPTSTLLWAMSHQIMCLDTQMSLATAHPRAIHLVRYVVLDLCSGHLKRDGWVDIIFGTENLVGEAIGRWKVSISIYMSGCSKDCVVKIFWWQTVLGAAGFSFVATNTYHKDKKKSSPGSSAGDSQAFWDFVPLLLWM